MSSSPKVSIAVPALNEEASVAQILTSLLSLDISKEIVFVDDGSTDKTLQIAQDIAGKSSGTIRIFRHFRRKGKGTAIITALKNALGEYFAIQDADLEYDPFDIPQIIEFAEKNSLDACFGSRFMKENPVVYPQCVLANHMVSRWISLLTSVSITDSYTCRKIIKTKLMRDLKLRKHGFEIEAEIATKIGLLAGKKIIRFDETPISYIPRTVKEGKKIGLLDAIKAFWLPLQIKVSGKIPRLGK